MNSKEVDEKQSINEGAVEKNTDLKDSLQVELSNFLDLGSCQDVETLDIAGFIFEIQLGTETSSHQEEREIEIGHSQSPADADSMTTSSSSEEHELENDHSISCQSNHSSLNNKPKQPLFEKYIICEKSVKKKRDHLNYFHNLQSKRRLTVFLSSYYSTIRTKKCIQCETCLKKFQL